MMNKYKPQGKQTLFDEENTQQKLSNLGNPLERLERAIDFEMFREDLERAMLNKSKKTNVGAKPYDVVKMFKIMILQRYYNISDEQAEYQIYVQNGTTKKTWYQLTKICRKYLKNGQCYRRNQCKL